MPSWFTSLRALGLLRRTTRALERIATNSDTIAAILEHDHKLRTAAPRKPMPTTFDTLDLKAAEEAWTKQREESLLDIEDGR